MKDMEQYILATAKERETSEQLHHRQRMEYYRRQQARDKQDKKHMRITIVSLVLILAAMFASVAVNRQMIQTLEPAPTKTTIVEYDLN